MGLPSWSVDVLFDCVFHVHMFAVSAQSWLSLLKLALLIIWAPAADWAVRVTLRHIPASLGLVSVLLAPYAPPSLQGSLACSQLNTLVHSQLVLGGVALKEFLLP